jgi:hypothetical protein
MSGQILLVIFAEAALLGFLYDMVRYWITGWTSAGPGAKFMVLVGTFELAFWMFS